MLVFYKEVECENGNDQDLCLGHLEKSKEDDGDFLWRVAVGDRQPSSTRTICLQGRSDDYIFNREKRAKLLSRSKISHGPGGH